MSEQSQRDRSDDETDDAAIGRRGYLGVLASLGVAGLASGTAAGSTTSDSLTIGNTTLRSNSEGFHVELDTNSDDEPLNFIAGHPDNGLGDSSAVGVTIFGGRNNINGDQYNNYVYDDYATVSGGYSHGIGRPYDDSAGSTISGGIDNSCHRECSTVGGGKHQEAVAKYSTIAGGRGNNVNGQWSTVGGGYRNSINWENEDPEAIKYATIAGGNRNEIEENGEYGTVGGGDRNDCRGKAATVPGGRGNTAAGDHSFAAGTYANADADWSFVWNDGSGESDSWGDYDDQFRASTDDGLSDVSGYATFNVKATDGVRFVTATDNSKVTWISADSAGWSSACSRTVKTNVESVDPDEALRKVESLSINTWEYEDADGEGNGVRHMSPMAEEFHAEFDLGDSEMGINSINADGVTMAAIQGLSERHEDTRTELDETKRQNERLQSENERLRERLDDLERRVEDLAAARPESTTADD